MIKSNSKQWIALFFLICLLLQSPIIKADENSFGHRVFVMQEKQANKGNTLAQFKLGTFYEFGISVKPDAEKARMWYEKAARKKNKAAVDRLVYLDIKQRGYNESLHSKWLSKVSTNAKNGNANALIILGQLHHHGLGVNKDLKKAAQLLNHASSLSHTEVDREIEDIKRKIASKDKKMTEKKSQKEIKKVDKKKAKPAKVTPKKAKVNKSEKNKEKKAILKRKKYEETMRKLRQEELILQQQQDWTEESEE